MRDAGPKLLSSGSHLAASLPVFSCELGKDCWVNTGLALFAEQRESLSVQVSTKSSSSGLLALMLFCGAGSILGGPWPVADRLNISDVGSNHKLPFGEYEICFCAPMQVGDMTVSCTEGVEFRYLRGLLRLHNGSLSAAAWPWLPEAIMRPLPKEEKGASFLAVVASSNEISPGVVYCKVGTNGQTDSSCTFTLKSPEEEERHVALAFVPITRGRPVLCTSPGPTMKVTVKGQTEVKVVPFVPSRIKYAICADGLLVGTLFTSGKLLVTTFLF